MKTHKHKWATVAGSRFWEAFECKCGRTKTIYDGINKKRVIYGK